MAKKKLENDIFGTSPRKKAINSKRKGNENELVVCSVLQQWTLGEEFVRVPASGGLRWKNLVNICGDVIPTNHKFNFIFSTETKHRKDIKLGEGEFHIRYTSALAKAWYQCKRDSIRINKIPMMMLRENGMPAGTFMVFFEEDVTLVLRSMNMLHCMYVSITTPDGIDMEIYGFDSNLLFSVDYYVLFSALSLSRKFEKVFKI